MSCEKRHTRKQTAVIEGSCGCVVVLFDCGCQYLERSCVYAQVLLGTLPKPANWIDNTGDGDMADLQVHTEELVLLRPLFLEIPHVRDFRDGP